MAKKAASKAKASPKKEPGRRRARQEDGQFQKDDPVTPQNEAFENPSLTVLRILESVTSPTIGQQMAIKLLSKEV